MLARPSRMSRASSSGGVRGVAHVHDLRGLELRDELARHRRVRIVLHHGGEIAHVVVDGVTKQDDLHERHADDHAEGHAVARKLAHFLGGHGFQPAHAASNLVSGQVFRPRRHHEHVFEAGIGEFDLRLDAVLFQQRAQLGLGVLHAAVGEHAQPDAELSDAVHPGKLADESRRFAAIRAFDFEDVGIDAGHQRARRAFGHHAAFGDDGEAVATLGFVHVVRGHEIVAPASASWNSRSQKSRRLCGSTALVGSSSSSSSGECNVAAASARRCF